MSPAADRAARLPMARLPMARLPVARLSGGLAMFVAARVAAGVATLLVISVLIFVGTQLLPGDVAQAMLGRNASAAALAAVWVRLSLDLPAPERYLRWITGLLHGDLGQSAAGVLAGRQGGDIWTLIAGRLLNTAILAGAAFLVIVPLGAGLGVACAVRRGGALDRLVSAATVALVALPEFVTGTLLALVFSTWLGLLPAVTLLLPGRTPLSNPRLLVLPVLTLLVAALAPLVRMLRAGMVEALRAPYVEAAELNGIGRRRIVLRYALRNALAPGVQVIAQTAQWLVGGVLVTEVVFNYPGIGQALVQAVMLRDIPFVESVAVLLAGFIIAGNIAADVAVIWLVPRLRSRHA